MLDELLKTKQRKEPNQSEVRIRDNRAHDARLQRLCRHLRRNCRALDKLEQMAGRQAAETRAQAARHLTWCGVSSPILNQIGTYDKRLLYDGLRHGAAGVIHSEIDLKGPPSASTQALLDSKQFAAVTGAPAEIQREAGGSFSSFRRPHPGEGT